MKLAVPMLCALLVGCGAVSALPPDASRSVNAAAAKPPPNVEPATTTPSRKTDAAVTKPNFLFVGEWVAIVKGEYQNRVGEITSRYPFGAVGYFGVRVAPSNTVETIFSNDLVAIVP